VLAVPQPDGITTLKAFVVLAGRSQGSEATTRALQDYVKGRLLPYKYPRVVDYLEDLPKTGTGKIDRQALSKRK
jgi:acetyl-CoA synthetase